MTTSDDPDRRNVLKAGAVTLGAAAFARAVAPVTEWVDGLSVEGFLQKHYKELSKEEMNDILRRHEKKTADEYGREVQIQDVRPIPGVQFAYALNLSVCIGCRRCSEACHRENNHDRPSGSSYIRVLEMKKGSIDLEQGNSTYDHPVPSPGHFYMPVQCQQCENPPCTKVCPVEATWQEEDGIVVVDYNW
ncbi:MAG: 4Fe-4S dicluster domain-containing protein, partial [Myxococcales bacterium]|nr:4Fe-4S dicluster domain-containing protein [Myxococcales bacterium]